MILQSRISKLETILRVDSKDGIVTAESFESVVKRFKKAVWAMQNIRPMEYSDEQARIDAKKKCESRVSFRGFADDVNLTAATVRHL